MSPALADRLSTTEPPGEFLPVHFFSLPLMECFMLVYKIMERVLAGVVGA